MKTGRSGTSSSPKRERGAGATTSTSQWQRVFGTREMEIVSTGSPAQIMSTLAALEATGELIFTPRDTQMLGEDEVDIDDANIETSDDPEDDDEPLSHPATSDDSSLDNEGIHEALSFQVGGQQTTWQGSFFAISMSKNEVRFILPSWVSDLLTVRSSATVRPLLFALARRLRFFEAFASWISIHRLQFASTFSLRYWGPNCVAELVDMYEAAGPNCLQKAMVSFLNQTDTRLRVTPPLMSRYLDCSVAVHDGRHIMVLSDLFSAKAQAVWCAHAVTLFIREHELPVASLEKAADDLAKRSIRTAASRVGADPRAMRLQDFLLYVRKPLARTVSVAAIVVEAKRLLLEDVHVV